MTFSVQDKDGGLGTDAVMVEVVNRAPQLTVEFPQIVVDEGASATNQGTITDEDGDAPALLTSLGELTLDGTNWSWHKEMEDGPFSQSVTLIADDGHGGYDATQFDLVVNNVPPALDPIHVDQNVVALGSPIQMNAGFSDPGSLDTHTAVWDWGDGTTSDGVITSQDGVHSVSVDHSYSAMGIYKVSLSVTDKDGGVATASYQYAVVYDSSGGFATGGGWITSPAGACRLDDVCPAAAGRASFGFVAKYKDQKGANVPTGETEFQFKAANLNFHSTGYEWLVVAAAATAYNPQQYWISSRSSYPSSHGRRRHVNPSVDGPSCHSAREKLPTKVASPCMVFLPRSQAETAYGEFANSGPRVGE